MFHSLVRKHGTFSIESERLPLGVISMDSVHDGEETPYRVSSPLPSSVQETLRLDAPLELFCVNDNEKDLHQPLDDPGTVSLPSLCLYTRKSVFVLHLSFNVQSRQSFSPSRNEEPPICQGNTVLVTEPFERLLLEGSYSMEILRVRRPPTKKEGNSATICIPGSLAMFAFDREKREYILSLFHPGKGTTTPLAFGVEYLVDGDEYVDFCFGISRELSLLSAMSVFFLKDTGDISFASPILFHSTAVSKVKVQESLRFISTEMETVDRQHPKWRQLKAAERFILDCCPVVVKGAYSNVVWNRALSEWPVKLQGPIIFDTEPASPKAFSIEPFGRTELNGLSIGREACVDFALVSPTALVPRFAYENRDDTCVLDDHLRLLAAKIERVNLAAEEYEPKSESVTIKVDPIVSSLVHYVTPSAVCSISTNSVSTAVSKIKGRVVGTERTSAWAVAASQYANIQGIAVIINVMSGHELVVGLEDGTAVPYHVARVRIENEICNLFESSQGSTKLLEDEKSYSGRSLSTKPFSEEVGPVVAKLYAGLGEMTKLVGSDTMYQDLTPSKLEDTIDIRDRCDDKVVIPLLELKSLIVRRQQYVDEVVKAQTSAIEKLSETLSGLKQRSDNTSESVHVLQINSGSIQERTRYVTQACNDFKPTVSRAERDYFNFLKRNETKVHEWKDRVEKLKSKFSALFETTQTGAESTENQLKLMSVQINSMLDAVDRTLRDSERQLKETELQLKQEFRDSGLEAENISSNISRA